MSILPSLRNVVIAASVCLFPLSATSAQAGDSTMHVKIDQGDTHKTKRIVLSLDKGAIIELPTDARDVLVSNPSIVDAMVRTSRRTYILGKSVGQANVFFLDAHGKQILNIEIQVERDLQPLDQMLKRYLPTSRIEVAAINDKIVLSGFVPSAAASSQARELAAKFISPNETDMDKVLNLLAIDANEQVMLKVRIVEMQRNVSKQFGVSWDAFYTPDGNFSIVDGLPTTSGDSLISVSGDNPFSLLGSALTGSGIGVSNVGSSGGVTALLGLMERTGLVKTLAEPTLTAISGESANFLAGGEFPVPTGRDRDGNVNVTFKKFGVGLGFTPVVLSSGRISLRISTEVSELTTTGSILSGGGTVTNEDGSTSLVAGISIPALRVRRAESTVELPSGGSLVMAGLLQEKTAQSIDGLPGAKDIPVLGALFRSRDFQSNETELVIIVTPYLVRPVNERDIKTPADGFAAPSDMGTILLGRLNSVYGVNKTKSSGQNWQGPVGHIVE